MQYLLCGLNRTGCFLHSLQVSGKTTAVITDSRGGHGPLPLGVPEKTPLVAIITLEEDIVVKHYLLLLSIPWELTHPAAASAKFSGHLVNLPKAHYHFPGPCN